MDSARTTFIATLVVIATGTLWGFYWMPVRKIAELGLTGAWGTLAIVAAAAMLLAPLGWRGRRALMASHPIALASVALGGLAFLLYSVGFLYGRVAIIVILFFLTPVWSTLIGRYLMGWPISRLRVLALVVGVAGLAIMLGGDGALPIPRGLGDWFGLTSGLLWAVATVGIRVKATAGPGETAFVFAAGAVLGGLIIAPLLEPAPNVGSFADPVQLAFWVCLTGALWWAMSMGGLMWAATKLDPARVGILLMAEVLIASVTAALIAGETLSTSEVIGGLLVVVAGVFEIWPERERS
ncbi:DMT family transporter [Yoonia sp. F2084L]|uniref:DMT family transporter n=1 Tax=Yoonia sp. F2084L TaxID=2926419 RepID=UPI001FF212B0|nr:DMT family transporter [Yoonia sp. F2084L]MCK0094339.1 DMT family transporter [Yoonia sp. F2084L]